MKDFLYWVTTVYWTITLSYPILGGDNLYTRQELLELEKMELETINPNLLKELTEIKIDQNIPVEERLDSFFHQIKNPYYFLVNGTPVQISFANHTGKTLDHCLYNYLSEIKYSDHEEL